MALWFKPKKQVPQLSLSFDKKALQNSLTKGFERLYEMRSEPSYKVLLDQLQIAKNMYVLQMSEIKPDANASHNIAECKGGIKALEFFQTAIEQEFLKLKAQQADPEKGYGVKITGTKPRRNRPSI